MQPPTSPQAVAPRRLSRRGFLAFGGAATAVALSGCELYLGDNPTDPNVVTLDFSSDVGVLNYAYALEQLEAAFYARVVNSPYANMSAEEMQILTDLRNHEVIHREFFKVALGNNAIRGLTPNFSSIDFTSRASVLATAKTFEDLGVSAYNGAGRYLSSDTNLLVAGKIVSVEARHAAAIRDLLNPMSDDFADNADANGLDFARTPSQVLQAASPFIRDNIALANV